MNEFRMLLTKDPQFPIIRLDLRSSISDRPLSTFIGIGVYCGCVNMSLNLEGGPMFKISPRIWEEKPLCIVMRCYSLE